jgi:hypothetical protein
VVKPDSTVEMRDVTVQHTEGEQSAVTGLTAPEPVVTDGVDNLQPGGKVTTGPPGGAARGGPGAPAGAGGEGKGAGGGGKGGGGAHGQGGAGRRAQP